MEQPETRYVPAYDAEEPDPPTASVLDLLALLALVWVVDPLLGAANWLQEAFRGRRE